jgi:electron transfer flavoprotein alpha subunit
LIVAEHDGSTLNPSTAKCIACAQALPQAEISVIVCAAQVSNLAAEAASLEGVGQVLTIEHPANQHALAAVLAPQIVPVAHSFAQILGPSNSFGKDLMPRIAALLDTAQVSDVMAIEGPTRFRRPIYAGNVLVTVEVDPTRPIVATVRMASFEGVKPRRSGDPARIESVTMSVDLPTHSRFVRALQNKTERPNLQTATCVISGGRGLGGADAFKLLYELARKMGAAVGASRAAVDAGYVPNELQVGQTGKIIAPDLYIAVGISGAIQHVAGVKDAGTIVAINRDGEAPIFEVADIGLVGDLFQVIPDIQRLIN